MYSVDVYILSFDISCCLLNSILNSNLLFNFECLYFAECQLSLFVF